MRHWLSFTLAYVIVLVAAGGAAVYGWWTPALAAGRETYSYRRDLSGAVERLEPNPARVAWLGDSHIMAPDAYPWRVGQMVEGSETTVMAVPGLDAFGFYCAMDREIDRRQPKVIGLLAQMNTLHRGFGRPVNDLVSELPLAELPVAMSLPLYEVGLTVPKLLLFRVLRWEWGENALLFLDGIRRIAQDATSPGWLGAPQLPALPNVAEALRVVNATAARPFSAHTAKVQFLAATVRVARARGVQVLVVLEPLPVDQLRTTGHWDPAAFASRVAILRGEIERMGGTVVDLHDAIGADGFLDFAGHLNEKGHAQVADRLREPLARLLSTAPSMPGAS